MKRYLVEVLAILALSALAIGLWHVFRLMRG